MGGMGKGAIVPAPLVPCVSTPAKLGGLGSARLVQTGCATAPGQHKGSCWGRMMLIGRP